MISSVPIYDYRCDHCGHAFSAVQSFNDAPIGECPSCGKPPRRLIVPPAIVFKGSGWYKTDSRGKPPAEGSGTSSSDHSGDSHAASKDKAGASKDTKSDTTKSSSPPKSEGSS